MILILANGDLVVDRILGHAFDNLQAMVQVKLNTGDSSWELVSDMKSHCFQLLHRCALRNQLQNTAGWRWAGRITAIRRNLCLRATWFGDQWDAIDFL